MNDPVNPEACNTGESCSGLMSINDRPASRHSVTHEEYTRMVGDSIGQAGDIPIKTDCTTKNMREITIMKFKSK